MQEHLYHHPHTTLNFVNEEAPTYPPVLVTKPPNTPSRNNNNNIINNLIVVFLDFFSHKNSYYSRTSVIRPLVIRNLDYLEWNLINYKD